MTGGSRLPGPKAGFQLLVEHPFQVCNVSSCVYITGSLTSKETNEKTKTTQSVHVLNPWRVRKIPQDENVRCSHKMKQMLSHGTELLFPCDKELWVLCQKGLFPPNTCDIFVCAAFAIS